MSEQDIQREILRYLHARGIFCWKAGVGGMHAFYREKERFVKFGFAGQSDILGLLPGGRFLAIEVKNRNGVLTAPQNAFLNRINKEGGAGFVCRSVAQCHAYITELIGGPAILHTKQVTLDELRKRYPAPQGRRGP